MIDFRSVCCSLSHCFSLDNRCAKAKLRLHLIHCINCTHMRMLFFTESRKTWDKFGFLKIITVTVQNMEQLLNRELNYLTKNYTFEKKSNFSIV